VGSNNNASNDSQDHKNNKTSNNKDNNNSDNNNQETTATNSNLNKPSESLKPRMGSMLANDNQRGAMREMWCPNHPQFPYHPKGGLIGTTIYY
jgi:hypothetical protein